MIKERGRAPPQTGRVFDSDPTLHNVHAQPRQGDNREFNFAQDITVKTGDRKAVDFVLRVPVPGSG